MKPTDQLRQQRRWRELSAALARALTNDPRIHLRQQLFFQGNQALATSPHVRLQNLEQPENLRGVADSLSFRLLYSDAKLHQSHRPEGAIARLVFDWLETLRCEALVPSTLPGSKHNLIVRFYHWSAGFHHHDHTQSEIGILLYTVAQMCWSRLHGEPVFPETADLIEATRANLAAELGHDLAGLRRNKTEQVNYIPHALAIAHCLQSSIEHAQSQRQKKQKESDESTLEAFALLLDMDTDTETSASSAASNHFSHPTASSNTYRIFTREFDTISHVAETIRPELLEEYREQIHARRQNQQLPFHPLVQRLRRALMQPIEQQWESDQEEGLIDGKRLSQLISSPMERRLFKRPQPRWTNDSSISFLIDCSGSMKHHAETLTMMVDLLTHALEKSGAATEVLGFSTNAWNGGRAYRQWQARSRQPYPGRLNETDHRIFKAANTTWKQANRHIMALLKADLYREGIDGEAVQWACQRLLDQPTRRKLLYVISDGSPMDSATALTNDEDYLSQHLQQVLQHYQAYGVEIWGIGIGLDLSHLYPNHLIADLDKGLDNHFIDDFIRSLQRPRS